MRKEDKIFVAGGTGMVGSAILRRLLSSGFVNVVASCHSRKPPGTTDVSHYLRWAMVDLTRQADTEVFFEHELPDYVFLAAAKVGGILANDTYRADFIYDNLAIATNVIKSAHLYGAKKLLNLGSSCIYPRNAPQPMREEYLLTGPLEPTNEPYAIAKIAAIKLCRYFNEQYRTDFISVMPSNLYGPNDNFNLETSHVVPALIRKFHLAKLLRKGDYEGLKTDIGRHRLGFGLDESVDPGDKQSVIEALRKMGILPDRVTMWGTGEPYREFLHVDDLAEAVLFVMENHSCRTTGELVNIGSGEEISLRNLAHLIKKIVGFAGEVDNDLSKHDGMPKKLLSVSRAGQLGWRSSTTLEAGIRETYETYVSSQTSPSTQA
jgi:GDP-L-fucose synthase